MVSEQLPFEAIAAFAAGIAVLFALLLVRWRRRRRPAAATPAPLSIIDTIEPPTPPQAVEGDAPSRPIGLFPALSDSALHVGALAANTEPAPAAIEPDAAKPVRRRPKTAWELAAENETPEGLLEKAHTLLASGDHEAAMVQLRACARLASKMDLHAIEAVARLELGDIAGSHGDMTTACEHWQIARSLYSKMQKLADAAAAAQRMEKAGCPTDWVLTGF